VVPTQPGPAKHAPLVVTPLTTSTGVKAAVCRRDCRTLSRHVVHSKIIETQRVQTGTQVGGSWPVSSAYRRTRKKGRLSVLVTTRSVPFI